MHQKAVGTLTETHRNSSFLLESFKLFEILTGLPLLLGVPGFDAAATAPAPAPGGVAPAGFPDTGCPDDDDDR